MMTSSTSEFGHELLGMILAEQRSDDPYLQSLIYESKKNELNGVDTRFAVEKSRLLFGVWDRQGLLEEGQVKKLKLKNDYNYFLIIYFSAK